jgi:hypothetical protein
MNDKRKKGLIAFFTLLGLGTFIAIAGTCYKYNLFDFATQDLDWTKQWLLTTVVDYYGCALCLCMIALLSEPFPEGIAWSIGFCLLGSPICCIYCIYRYVYMK